MKILVDKSVIYSVQDTKDPEQNGKIVMHTKMECYPMEPFSVSFIHAVCNGQKFRAVVDGVEYTFFITEWSFSTEVRDTNCDDDTKQYPDWQVTKVFPKFQLITTGEKNTVDWRDKDIDLETIS